MTVNTAIPDTFHNAEQVVDAIAGSEAEFVSAPKLFAGFVRKVTKTRVDFHWARAKRGKPSEMTINKHGVICSRSVVNGRNWYGYTLDPFGEDVSYSVEREAARLILARFIPAVNS